MYNIEIKKLNYSTQIFIDGINWNSDMPTNEYRKRAVIENAVYQIDAENDIPPELVDPLIEQGINSKSFAIVLLTSASKTTSQLHDEEIKNITFKI